MKKWAVIIALCATVIAASDLIYLKNFYLAKLAILLYVVPCILYVKSRQSLDS